MKKDAETNIPVVLPRDSSVPVTGELLRANAPGDDEEWSRRRMTHVTVSALHFEATTIDEIRTRTKSRNA